MAKKEADAIETKKARLIQALRSQGVTENKVLDAIERTPRELFTPELFSERAWEDSALPIACGQTISQPYIVGLMTQSLKLEPRARVLEIGTGSGYQTAILARIARLVYTVERYRTLMGEAEARFKTLGLLNIVTRFGAGGEGWPEQAPFDRILVTAAAALGVDGLLVAGLAAKTVARAPAVAGAAGGGRLLVRLTLVMGGLLLAGRGRPGVMVGGDQLQPASVRRPPGVRREHAERGRRRRRPQSPHHSSARLLGELRGLWRPAALPPTSKFARRPIEQGDEAHVA